MAITKACLGTLALLLASVASAQTSFQIVQQPQDQDVYFPQRNFLFQEFDDGSILVTDAKQQLLFQNFFEYTQSSFFQDNGLHCGHDQLLHPFSRSAPSDCSNSNTSILPEYEPAGGQTYVIPVVFHVLMNTNGAGNVTDAAINQQIAVLNADYASNTNTNITFELAGVTRTVSRQGYNDRGDYYSALSWDVNQYLNIYTNTAGGYLGYAYVPNGGGVVGNIWDRVVLYWASVGNPAPYGPPYHLGKTAVHEVGHYLGLYHTFDGGCVSGSSPACYGNGDLICDTNPESQPNFSPCSRTTCGSPDPTNNYMDYSDDVCMDEFTPEQANRLRCTLANFRTGFGGGDPGGDPPGPASNPSPSNGATGVSTSANLSWTAGSGATSHDVYFGTDSTPDAGEFQGNQGGTSFDPGTLANNTTYYWRIDEVNVDGTTAGPVWSFTTAGGGGGISLSAVGYKVQGVHHADLSWSGNSGNVDIFRDGNMIDSNVGGSSYTDNIGVKGGNVVYVYQVCETGGGACSNTASANP